MAQPQGPVYENPSADKFGPPPSPLELPSDGRQGRRLIRMACVIGIYLAAYWLQVSFYGRGWLTTWALVVLGSEVLMIIEQRIRKGEHPDNNPYSPPTTITR